MSATQPLFNLLTTGAGVEEFDGTRQNEPVIGVLLLRLGSILR
jgi:hypothetical protein